jgi:hypothetical protein
MISCPDVTPGLKHSNPHSEIEPGKSRQDFGFVGLVFSRRRRRAWQGPRRARAQMRPIRNFTPLLAKYFKRYIKYRKLQSIAYRF